MRKNYTHLIIILDKSGSMGPLASDTIGGVNKLVADQKALPGNFTAALYQFNESLHEVQSFIKLDAVNYQPSGGTALLDAVCTVVDQEGVELNAIPPSSRPDKVVVLIVTDGHENSSTKFKRQDVQNRVKLQSEIYKWQFVFLGANVDAFSEAKSMNISAGSTYQFAMTPDGIHRSYTDISSSLASYRAGTTADVDMTQQTK